MSLAIGSPVGVYEIAAPLGAGGPPPLARAIQVLWLEELKAKLPAALEPRAQ